MTASLGVERITKTIKDPWRFLAEATARLDSSLDSTKVLASLAELTVPAIADICAIDVCGPQGIERVAVAAREPEKKALMFGMQKHGCLNLDMALGPAFTIRTGRAQLHSEVMPAHLEAAARSPEHLADLRAVGFTSGMCVPLVARDRVIGAISFGVTRSDRYYDEQDLSFATDLAQRAALAVDNAALFERAREAVRLRDELLAIVSHDLKNPLTSILLSAEMQLRVLRTGGSAELMQGQTENIKLAAQQMRRLIMDLLDLARLGSGHLPLDRKPVLASELMARTRELQGSLAAQKNIALQTHISDRRAHVECDHDRVLQVIGNIVGNAIKFTPEGGVIRVEATVEHDTQYMRFAVHDTGPGISPEHLSHVFDRYWQGRRTTRQSAGLGLSIAKGIVEAHGGRIWAESRAGEGSTFYFTLKMVQ